VVQEILADIEDVTFCRLTSADVVRHRLVGEIIDAYERWDATARPHDGKGRHPGGRRESHGEGR
jgi:phosphate starvation-inducible PhoH-like protein